jgi:hypothetical protein
MEFMTYFRAGEFVYFASMETVKKLALSWLETMTITADKVAEKAKNLNKRWHILLVLAMDFTKLIGANNESLVQGKVK